MATPKKYRVGKSKIQGQGAFAKKDLNVGEYIGKVHTINKLYTDYDFTELGKKHNHSEDPNVQNILIGNERHLFATRPIEKGEELTSNYRLQPDLEQPDGFNKAEDGESLTKEKALEILSDGRVYGKRLTRKQKKFFGAVAGGAEPYKAQNGIEGTMGGLTDKGFNFNPAWGGAWKNGGWLDKYSDDVPQAQNGDILEYLKKGKAAPVVTKGKPLSDEMQKRITSETLKRQTQKNKSLTQLSAKQVKQQQYDLKQKAEDQAWARDKKIKEEEEQVMIAEGKAAEATRENPNVPFTFPTGETKLWKDMDWREQQYVSGKNLGSSLRFNNWTDYINPLAMIGDLGEGLSSAPYLARETGSNLPYVLGAGLPLLTGPLSRKGVPKLGKYIKKLSPMEDGGNLQPPMSGAPQPAIPMAQFGLTYLEPNSYKLPRVGSSSELAMSVGGENGEPAYLIPSMKYGRMQVDPMFEFKRTGEHLGGPFKTWQEAEAWERDVRHPYVEKNQSIPTPYRRWGQFEEGGSIPSAQKGNKSQKSNVSKNPYKEVDASGANFFRDILPVPDNVAQMLAKVVYNDARMNNESLDDEQKMILWDVIQNAIKRSGKTSGGTEYQDYGNIGYGTPEFFNESFNRGKGNVFSIAGNSIFNKGYRLASTIGRGRYWTDEKDPNIIYYTDVYDWNPSEKNFKGSSTYQVLRNTLRSGEDKSLNPEKNEPYRMNFKLNKKDIDKYKQAIKATHSTDDERFITAPIGENGMSIPGSVGFTYARVAGAAPSEGPRAKKTMPSAQNGMEMKYYQEGLDWKPKTISKNGGWLDKYDDGGSTGCPPNHTKIGNNCIPNSELDKIRRQYEVYTQNRGDLAQQSGVKTAEQISRDADMRKAATAAAKKKEERDRVKRSIENQGTIDKPGPKQSGLSRAWEIATHPVQYFGYAARNQEAPQYFSRGDIDNLDLITSTINPLTIVDAAANVPRFTIDAGKSLFQGNLLGAGANLGLAAANVLGALPLAGAAINAGSIAKTFQKGFKNAWDYTSNLPKTQRLRNALNVGAVALKHADDVPGHSYFGMSPDVVRQTMAGEIANLPRGAYTMDLSMSNNSAPLFWNKAAQLSNQGFTIVRPGTMQSVNASGTFGRRVAGAVPQEAAQLYPDVIQAFKDRIAYLNQAGMTQEAAAVQKRGVMSDILSNLQYSSVTDPTSQAPKYYAQFLKNYKPTLDEGIIRTNQATGLGFPMTEIVQGNNNLYYAMPTAIAVKGNPLQRVTKALLAPWKDYYLGPMKVPDQIGGFNNVRRASLYRGDSRFMGFDLGNPLIQSSLEIPSGLLPPLLRIQEDEFNRQGIRRDREGGVVKDDDYEFDGTRVREYPVAQGGRQVSSRSRGPILPSVSRPTSADTLTLYNQSLRDVAGFMGPNLTPRETYNYIASDQSSITGETRRKYPNFLRWATRNGIQPIALRNMVSVSEDKPETYKNALVLYPKPKPSVKKETPKVEAKKEVPTKPVSQTTDQLNMFRNPDVELLVDQFGNYEWFRKDDPGDMIPVRRATREEIEYSKKQKQRNGGVSVNRADEYPLRKLDDLLNFTNYNKPKAKKK